MEVTGIIQLVEAEVPKGGRDESSKNLAPASTKFSRIAFIIFYSFSEAHIILLGMASRGVKKITRELRKPIGYSFGAGGFGMSHATDRLVSIKVKP